MSRRVVISHSLYILVPLSLVLIVFFALFGSKQSATAQDTPGESAYTQQAAEDLRKVSENLTQAQKQQKAERASVIAELTMPDGYHYSEGESFDSLTAQAHTLESRLSERSAGISDSPAPELVKYEDGYFAASAASDWQCAWLVEAVKHSQEKDFKKVDRDIAKLESFKKSSYIKHFPDFEIFLQDAVYPLTKGETEVAQSFINTSCSLSQP